MLRDPIELYEYPWEWHRDSKEIAEKVASGLFILKKDGFLKRGITTGTTASAAVIAAIASLYEEVTKVRVLTPVGIEIEVKVEAENGFAVARKFSGDHSFDATDKIEIVATISESGIEFGKGVGEKNGRKSVSKSAFAQICENFERACKIYGYKGGVLIEIPEGESVAKLTKNAQLSIKNGLSILGTTGFVEPWCDELVKTKVEIAKRYSKIVIATGRKSWEYARKKYQDFQPFVFGLHLDEVLREHEGRKIVVGYPGLLKKWAGEEGVFEKAKRFGAEVDIIAEDYWGWDM